MSTMHAGEITYGETVETDLAIAANDFSVAMAAEQHRALTLFVKRDGKRRRRAWKTFFAALGFGIVASALLTGAVNRSLR